MDIQALRDAVLPIFSDLPEIRLVYLFGSQVDCQTGPLSDVDLGLLLDAGTDEVSLQAYLQPRITRSLQAPVDLLILNNTPVEFAYAVIAQGMNLYQRSLLEKVEYEATVMSLYGDYLPVLRAQRSDILQGGRDAARVQRYREALGRTERALGEIKAVS